LQRGVRDRGTRLASGGTDFSEKRSGGKIGGDRAVLDAGFAGVNWDVRERRDPRPRGGVTVSGASRRECRGMKSLTAGRPVDPADRLIFQ